VIDTPSRAASWTFEVEADSEREACNKYIRGEESGQIGGPEIGDSLHVAEAEITAELAPTIQAA